VSEQLGFPYRRDLRHPRARRKALRGTWPRTRRGAWPRPEWRLARCLLRRRRGAGRRG